MGSVVDGKYRIEATIAEGGIGVIVRATHLGLGQQVAIKYLKPDALKDARLVERFEREARLAAQIASEHVVHVQDVGSLPGAGPYMVMEYLVGRDLGSIVEEGPLPVARAVDYVLQVCDALAEAHALRIVHRDIKPDNMFLAQRPSNTAILKLIDFGISKMAPKRGEGGDWAHDTGTDERFGTPLYMSPEQLRSPASVDERADIWALGVVLFELITGEAPFDAADMPALCAAIVSSEPRPLRALRPEAPQALEAVILKCLEKDPAQRFRNVAELAQDLEPFATTDGTSRVWRIKQVVRRGGKSIRPPTPAAAFTVQKASGAVPPGPEMELDPELPTEAPPGPLGWPLRRAGALLAGIVVAGVLAAAALTRVASPSVAPTAQSATAASALAPPSIAAAASTGEPVPAPAEPPTAAASSNPAPVESSLPAGVPPKRGSPPRTPSATAAPTDRRSLFGERQ